MCLHCVFCPLHRRLTSSQVPILNSILRSHQCALIAVPTKHNALAGTGPQVLVYDLVRGDLLLSQQVFDGVRVHGIHVRRESKNPLTTIAVHGEGRVKVLELQSNDRKLSVLQSLPRFFQWILDVRFLQVACNLDHLNF